MHYAKHLCAQLPQFFILCTPQAPLCSPRKDIPWVSGWHCDIEGSLIDAENDSSGLWSLLLEAGPVWVPLAMCCSGCCSV